MSIYQDLSPRMKKIIQGLLTLVLIGLVVSAGSFSFSYIVSGWEVASREEFTRQFDVSGEGKVSVRPDIATFTATVITQAEKVKDAQDENSKRSNKIAAFAKAQGVEEKDLKTVGYNIFPQYDSRPCIQTFPNPCPPETSRIISYEVRNSLEIKVRDLEKIDDLLSGMIEKGANQVGSIQFRIDDEDKAKEEARRKAIENAREKAKILAKDLGVRLGQIINFSESGRGFPIYAAGAYRSAASGIAEALPAPQIEPGEQEVVVSVSITYEFR